ncbi:Na+/H+ antiporter subunit E [bacterium]|nr:Na+/H+ antiporter subunit E [bacterium]
MIELLVHVLLTLAWLLLTGSFGTENIVLGVVLSYLMLALAVGRGEQRGYVQRLPAAVRLFGYFLVELIKANAQVAWEMIDPRHTMSPGVVEVPLDLKTPFAITLLSNLITLTPGTLTMEVSDDHTRLYVHGMYVTDPDRFRAEIKQGFERRVKEVFE